MRRARFQAPGALLAFHAGSLLLEFGVPEREPELFEKRDALAIVDIRGPLTHRQNWIWDSYEAIRTRVDAALASGAPTVMLRIDSCGGEVTGLFELAREIRTKAAAAKKQVVAYVEAAAFSAGYALACAADAIALSESAQVGSIGVLKVAVDVSAADRAMGINYTLVASGARKTDGHPNQPMTDDARAAIQRDVDTLASLFFGLVADARRMSPDAVAGLEAASFIGKDAIAAGLADQVIAFDAFAAALAAGPSAKAPSGAEAKMAGKDAAIAALVEMAKSDDEKEKSDAIAALAAMGLDADGNPKESEEAPEAAKSDGDGDEAPPEKKDADAKASASAAEPLALAAQVQSLAAKLAAREEAEERAKLMASRPDLASEVVAFLAKQPIATVRDAVKSLPKGPTRAQGSPVANAVAALGAAPTVQGETQASGTSRLPPDEKRALDEQMGLASPAQAIRHEGTRHFLGLITPEQARAEMQRREAARAGAQKGGAR